jgi:hypothetical protein
MFESDLKKAKRKVVGLTAFIMLLVVIGFIVI